MSGPDAFDRLMAGTDPSMVIVTTTDGEERAGCLVGFHAQSGIEPANLTVWLSKANHTFRVAVFAEHLAVHFPRAHDVELARTFGTLSGDDHDKFADVAWTAGPGGVPLLDGCPNRVVGRKLAVLDTRADHVCVVIEPTDARFEEPYVPLRLSDVAHLRAGHEAGERPPPRDTTSTGPPRPSGQ